MAPRASGRGSVWLGRSPSCTGGFACVSRRCCALSFARRILEFQVRGCSEAEFTVIFFLSVEQLCQTYWLEAGGRGSLGYFPELTLRWRADPGGGGCPAPSSVVEQRSFTEVVGLREGGVRRPLRLSEGPQPALGAGSTGAAGSDRGPGTASRQLVEFFRMTCAAVMGRGSGSPGLPVEALAMISDMLYLFLPLLPSLQSCWDQPAPCGQSLRGCFSMAFYPFPAWTGRKGKV